MKHMQSKRTLNKIKNAVSKKSTIVDDEHLLFTSPCLDVLKEIPSKSVRLVITDPPYNINLKYNRYKDNLPKEEYYAQLKEVLKELFRILTDDGSLYWVNYPELNARTLPDIEEVGFIFKRWLTWHYPTNIGVQKGNFTKSQRSILFCTKTKDNYFDKNSVAQPYKNPTVTKVKKRIEAGSKGCAPYDYFNYHTIEQVLQNNGDVFNINLLKNTSNDRAGNDKMRHPCQLPLGLLSIFIAASSDKGDIVLDAFAGTFTTNLAAKLLGRKSIGIELDSDYVKLGKKRLFNGQKR